MKVLLTGAAGNVGFETLKSLITKNNDVTVLELKNRKTIRKLKVYRKNIKIVYGSINDKQLVSNLVKDNDVIIHLAAIIPPLADKNKKLTKRVNYDGTKNIIDAIKKNSNHKFLVYSSSISVYGDRVKNYNISVNDELKPSQDDYYAKIKIETENMIKKSGIDYTIFRLTGIMGHPMLDALMFHMPLNTNIEFISNVDAGYAFSESIYHIEELKNKVFNLGGGEAFRTTYEEFLKKMLNIYGLNYNYINRKAFATKNFHCGFYSDTKVLDNILHFQRDTLKTYFERVDKQTNKLLKLLTRIFGIPIMYFLNMTSEPLKALKRKDLHLIKRFFNNEK